MANDVTAKKQPWHSAGLQLCLLPPSQKLPCHGNTPSHLLTKRRLSRHRISLPEQTPRNRDHSPPRPPLTLALLRPPFLSATGDESFRQDLRELLGHLQAGLERGVRLVSR